MASRSSASEGHCAPSVEIFKPGDEVRLRVKAEPPAAFKGILEAIVPKQNTRIVIGVVREATLHGLTTKYRLDGGLLIDPALVERVEPEASASGAAATPAPPDDAGEVRAETPRVEGGDLEWTKNSAGWRSTCDRFQINEESCYVVIDRWTHELGGGLTLKAAVEWCEGRIVGRPLNWPPMGGAADSVLRAKSGSREFSLSRCFDGRWLACDLVFEGTHRLRHSLRFATAEAAKEWCAIRAACDIEGDTKSPTATLAYHEPIPF